MGHITEESWSGASPTFLYISHKGPKCGLWPSHMGIVSLDIGEVEGCRDEGERTRPPCRQVGQHHPRRRSPHCLSPKNLTLHAFTRENGSWHLIPALGIRPALGSRGTPRCPAARTRARACRVCGIHDGTSGLASGTDHSMKSSGLAPAGRSPGDVSISDQRSRPRTPCGQTRTCPEDGSTRTSTKL